MHKPIDFDFISKLERSLQMNSKDEIDNAVAEVIRRDVANGKLKAQDNEKLIELRKRIIEDVKATNTPIRTWIKKLFKRS